MRLIFLMLLLLSGPAMAETWIVTLGDRQIGTVSLERGANGALTLTSLLDATPLGLADGSFTGRSFPAITPEGRPVTQYLGESSSPGKARNISVLTDGGLPVQTRVEPPSDATALSDPEAVPGQVLNPLEAFARIAGLRDCPEALRYYDGRRIIEILFKNKEMTGDSLHCAMDYRVVGGPGHLSPFRFRSVAMALDFSGAGPFTLHRIALSAGGFTVTLHR